MNIINTYYELSEKLSQNIFTASVVVHHYVSARVICVLGVLLLGVLCPDSVYAFDGSKYQEVCSRTLEILHGGFGALLMASAGVGAVVAAAAGGFRLAWSLVVVAVGAFTLKEYQEIWFEPC